MNASSESCHAASRGTPGVVHHEGMKPGLVLSTFEREPWKRFRLQISGIVFYEKNNIVDLLDCLHVDLGHNVYSTRYGHG